MLYGFSLFVNHAGTNILKKKDLKNFWIKRFIGIIPMYYISRLVYAFSPFDPDPIWQRIFIAPAELLGIQSDFDGLFTHSHNGGTWFISCIIICYFVYPLNDAREKLEEMIDLFHETFHTWDKPRTYRKTMRKEYLAVAKMRKRPAKKIRSLIRKELGCINRDLRYLEEYMHEGYALPPKYVDCYLTIMKLYEQQKYMYDHKTHRVENRIVSISQPYIRPIVRGKAKSPVEFGAKYDVSIDKKGHARLEKIQFDPYNESTILQDVIERYNERNGHYPARVLVNQIYRTRDNRKFCKDHGIRMSGPKLGRPSADHKASQDEYQDNTDRFEVERFFRILQP